MNSAVSRWRSPRLRRWSPTRRWHVGTISPARASRWGADPDEVPAAEVTWTLSLRQAESLLPGMPVRLMLILVVLALMYALLAFALQGAVQTKDLEANGDNALWSPARHWPST
jgi:hypothetical protein